MAVNLLSSFAAQPVSTEKRSSGAQRAPDIGNPVSEGEEDDSEYLSESDFSKQLSKPKVKQKKISQPGKFSAIIDPSSFSITFALP